MSETPNATTPPAAASTNHVGKLSAGVVGTGIASGLVTPGYGSAGLLAAASGAAIPLLMKEHRSAKAVAFSALSSTAIGLITQGIKQNYQQKEMEKRAAAATAEPSRN